MANPNGRKGSQRERELVNLLDKNGFAVMRAPASGGATERELPDVLAGDGSDFYAIEAKSSGKDVIYIDGKEIEELLYFANNFGAEARIGARFDVEHGDPAYGNDSDPGWYFFEIESLHKTDGGNYRLKKEKAISEGEEFSSLIGSGTQTRLV